MTRRYSIRCECGALEGTLDQPAWVNRVVCYCKSCQTFSQLLGRADDVLDSRGGSDILQTSPRHLTFTQGREHLACLRVTPAGPLRWYASCCRSPIGNTPANPGLSFVGLLHTCLGGHSALEQSFGPVKMHVFTDDAIGEPKPKRRIPPVAALAMAARLGLARLGGSYRQTPFFDHEGHPVASPEQRYAS